MPDMLFNGAMAYKQVAMLLGGGFCALIGLFLLAYEGYEFLRAERVTGTVIGIEKKDGMDGGDVIYPVYRYTLADGTTHQATSSVGAADPAAKRNRTGTVVSLHVMPGRPWEATPAGVPFFFIFGLSFFGPGVSLIYIALTQYPVTRMTGVILAGFALYGAYHAKGLILSKQARAAKRVRWQREREDLKKPQNEPQPTLTAEELLATPAQKAVAVQQTSGLKVAIPVCFIAGAGMLWGALHLGLKQQNLEQNGLRATGHIVRMEQSATHDGNGTHYTYCPVAAFATADGRQVSFRDRWCSNPPSGKIGDAVTVIYLAEDPSGTAMINRAARQNWIVPGALGLFGLFMLFAGMDNTRRMLAAGG